MNVRDRCMNVFEQISHCTLKGLYVTHTVNDGQMPRHVAFLLKALMADMARKRGCVCEAVYVRHMCLQVGLLLKYSTADVTPKNFNVTNAVNSSHVSVHAG